MRAAEVVQAADLALRVVRELLAFLVRSADQGARVAAYGAAAKGNTFLNAAGVRAPDILSVADRSPGKVGRRLPGSHIPVVSPEALLALAPDEILILPWNIADEVVRQQAVVRSWGGHFVVAVPALRVLD